MLISSFDMATDLNMEHDLLQGNRHGESGQMIKTRHMGEFDGRAVVQASLTSASGVEVDILNFGVVVRDWRVPVSEGLRSVVLGFETFAPYPAQNAYLGAIVGRVANRVRGSRFELGGKTYALASDASGLHLHGGPEGLSLQVWDMEIDSANDQVLFSHSSPDGAMGYPGNLHFEVLYRLKGNRLRLEMKVATDQPTPISQVQHHYFNLGTENHVLDHRVKIAADRYTVLDKSLFPTGEILPVEGSFRDMRSARMLRHRDGTGIDYDLNYVLDPERDKTNSVARVEGPEGELTLELWTDRPGLQFYNAVTTDIREPGLGGRIYGKHSGFCLEDQMFPDALNHKGFPSIICTPDRPYTHWCEIEIKQT